MSKKVYVMLGFHINFYHSWRGDTPDEAGFGTDMRVIRGVLTMLERAQAAGRKARSYWDTEVYWTFQEILPKYCPDILERLRARVAAGQDEIVLGPFNNGANHAATRDEFRASVEWAIENPWGSGLRQLFPKVTPFYRPQESVFTTGQEQVLKDAGVEGLILYYAQVPFNTLGVFTPALSMERRHNPFWFRSREDQPQMVVFPAMSAADVLEMGSLENMLLDLHARQEKGEIQGDVVIHLNEDADLESWLPLEMPALLRGMPNTGGLDEYIDVVNKYPWADFTVPGEYLASHPPQGEVLVRQDLADGGFDGSYSWAEKCASLHTWTLLEQSRLASMRAEVLAKHTGMDLRGSLWDGMESSFFKRLIGLSTTHFGMSTPVINEERQARAQEILGTSLRMALTAQRAAAERYITVDPGQSESASSPLYDLEILPTPPYREAEPNHSKTAMRIPLILPAGVPAVRVELGGKPVRAALTDCIALPGGRTRADLRFSTDLVSAEGGDKNPSHSIRCKVFAGEAHTPSTPLSALKNRWMQVEFSERSGLHDLNCAGFQVGGEDFLQPFITYRSGKKPVVYPAARWEFLELPGEHWDGFQRVRMQATLPMQTPQGEYSSEFIYTFTLFDDLPHLYVDVEARYAATPATDTIHNMIQKLRRLIDLRWQEVAPFQLLPLLRGSPSRPLRIWKHNFMGITAYYDLDYARVNPRNRNLDAFNHQVTAGWVAVSDHQHGLLVGENAEALASMAFCPMRLREQDGIQSLQMNPFGSYYGKQASYSHLGGTGLGEDFLKTFSGFLRPNGPSYNGQTLHFSILLAPYVGDEPPQALQQEAGAHFYPPAVVFHSVPAGLTARLPEDIHAITRHELHQEAVRTATSVPMPGSFLANPSHAQVDLVWDVPRNAPVTGYEAAWRAVGENEWHTARFEVTTRWQVIGLQDGQEYEFRLRAVCGEFISDWTQPQTCTPGAVTGSEPLRLGALPTRALLQILFGSLMSVIRARFAR